MRLETQLTTNLDAGLAVSEHPALGTITRLVVILAGNESTQNRTHNLAGLLCLAALDTVAATIVVLTREPDVAKSISEDVVSYHLEPASQHELPLEIDLSSNINGNISVCAQCSCN